MKVLQLQISFGESYSRNCKFREAILLPLNGITFCEQWPYNKYINVKVLQLQLTVDESDIRLGET